MFWSWNFIHLFFIPTSLLPFKTFYFLPKPNVIVMTGTYLSPTQVRILGDINRSRTFPNSEVIVPLCVAWVRCSLKCHFISSWGDQRIQGLPAGWDQKLQMVFPGGCWFLCPYEQLSLNVCWVRGQKERVGGNGVPLGGVRVNKPPQLDL